MNNECYSGKINISRAYELLTGEPLHELEIVENSEDDITESAVTSEAVKS